MLCSLDENRNLGSLRVAATGQTLESICQQVKQSTDTGVFPVLCFRGSLILCKVNVASLSLLTIKKETP